MYSRKLALKSLFVIGLSFVSQEVFATETYYTKPEGDLYMLIGYPSTTVYNALTGGHGGPPQIGLLGMMDKIAKGAITGINASGVSTCESAPATGSFTGSATISLTTTVTLTLTGNFATPSHTIPTGHTGAGAKYDKRIEMTFADPSGSGHTSKAAMEFVCGKDQAFVEFQIDGDSITSSYRTINMYIDSNDATSNKVEFMMKVTSTAGTTGTLYDAQLVRLDINKTASTFTLNGINFYYRSSTYQGYRVGIVGTAAGTASTYISPSSFGSTFASVTGTTSDYSTVAATSKAFSDSYNASAGTTYQGCLNFTTQADPASTALCSGTTLAAPSAPVVDSTGALTFTWMAANMNAKVAMGF
jgi:hypothetical protein